MSKVKLFFKKTKKIVIDFYHYLTLKKRILLVFFAGIIIPYLCVGVFSYNTIVTVLANNIDKNMFLNLKQVQENLKYTINNINHVSQMLTYDESICEKMDKYITSESNYEKSVLAEEIKSGLRIISFTNPNIGLILFYIADDDEYIFENAGIKEDFNINELPVFSEYYGIDYYGPHLSYNRFVGNKYVISAMRPMNLDSRDDVYVYLESDYSTVQKILEIDELNQRTNYILLDQNNRIIYSDQDEIFKTDTIFAKDEAEEESGKINGYYWFKVTSNQGWSIVSLILEDDYDKEKEQWLEQMGILLLAVLLFIALMSFGLWKLIYNPFNKLNNEIKNIQKGDFSREIPPTKVPEFDVLLNRFQDMKIQIQDLLVKIRADEKERADLQIEKLRSQINPHFLLNTLNNVHWMAIMENQDEIDEVVLSLIKLLSYNLDENHPDSAIRDEIESIKCYLILQNKRFSIDYKFILPEDDTLLDYRMPRFILQPIIENAVYHGSGDESHIVMQVCASENAIVISVSDKGNGMSEKEIKMVMKNKKSKDKVGMGIGLNFVRRTLEAYYEGKAEMKIESKINEGTTVSLILPFEEE